MEAPNYSVDSNQPISKLKRILIEQQDEMVALCTLVEYLRGFLQIGMDERDLKKYEEKLVQLLDRQNQRFQRIDALINNNILQMKKGITNDQSVLNFGKEIRKLEAGIRTLLLFTEDIFNMSRQPDTLFDRRKDRIGYFDTRSVALDLEIRLLLQKLAYV